MRNLWLIIVGSSLLLNSALAKPNNNKKKAVVLNIFNILTAQGKQVKTVSDVRLHAMNLALTQLKAKFIVKKGVEYKEQNLHGVRYVVKNISKTPIYLSEQFSKDHQLVALIVSDNILVPEAIGVVYLVKKFN